MLTNVLEENLFLNVSVSGLQAAAKVVDVGTSSMSPEEKKRFDAVAVRKRTYGKSVSNSGTNSKVRHKIRIFFIHSRP